MIRWLAAALLFATGAPAAAVDTICTIPCAQQCRTATGNALIACERRCAVTRKKLCLVPSGAAGGALVGAVVPYSGTIHHSLQPHPAHHDTAAPATAIPQPRPAPPPPAAMPAPPPPPEMSYPPAPPPRNETAPPVGETQSIATRLFVDSIFLVPGDFGAVAVLLLPNDAAADPERVKKICYAYVNALPPANVVAREIPRADQMVTLWPVVAGSRALDPTNQDVHGAGADNSVCPVAVRDYDYIQAQERLKKLPPSVDFGTGRGPFLVAWAPPGALGQPRVPILVYDLSAFDTPAALRRAMRLWIDEIEDRPETWRNGWKLTHFQLQAAAEADAFGSQILAAIKLVPFLGNH